MPNQTQISIQHSVLFRVNNQCDEAIELRLLSVTIHVWNMNDTNAIMFAHIYFVPFENSA